MNDRLLRPPGEPVALDEIERMLRAYAGPDLPAMRPARTRRWKWLALAGAVAVCAVAVPVALVVADGDRKSVGPPSGGQCADVLTYRGTAYTAGTGQAAEGLSFGPVVGMARVPACRGRPGTALEVVRIRGVDPGLALVVTGREPTIYVAAEACRDLELEREPGRCLSMILRQAGAGS